MLKLQAAACHGRPKLRPQPGRHAILGGHSGARAKRGSPDSMSTSRADSAPSCVSGFRTAAARVARTVGPTATRFAQPDIAVPFETEPATFLAVARKGARR